MHAATLALQLMNLLRAFDRLSCLTR